MTQVIYEPSKTTHWKNLFPQKTLLLGSHNLNEGEELIAEIKSVSLQTIKGKNGKEDQVPVAEFTNAPPMVLNITNCTTIASLYGESYAGWVGKSIQLFATEVKDFGGGKTVGLRVRPTIPTNEAVNQQYADQLQACETLGELKEVFMALPKHIKPQLEQVKNTMKENLS